MTGASNSYASAKVGTLPEHLGRLYAITDRPGTGAAAWKSRKAGESPFNLGFVLKGPQGEVIARHAQPDMRWPLRLKHAVIEGHAPIRRAKRARMGDVPQVNDLARKINKGASI